MSKYRQFNLLLLLFTSLPIVTVSGVNWLVDPYQVFNTPNFLGINHIKPEKDNNDRLYKALDIIRLKPKTIIVGSSRVKQGINPNNPIFEQKQPVYNLGLNGANMYELLRYVEHSLTNQPDLETIILGLDFFMFNADLGNQPSFSEHRLDKSFLTPIDGINALFSVGTFSVSHNTFLASLNQPERETIQNGFLVNPDSNDGETVRRFESSLRQYFSLHSDYQLSPEYLRDFEKIVQLCQENGINLIVFISPPHVSRLEAIYITRRWQIFEDWKREITRITPVWDFSGYNSVTSEPLADYMTNYIDESHYTKEIGDLILARIFQTQKEGIPPDFGVFLTSENIEKHLANIREDREKWLQTNPREVVLIKKLYDY